MRRAILAAVIVAIAAFALGGSSPLGRLSSGSSFAFLGDGLRVMPDDPACATFRPCPLRYAYAPDRTLTIWFSVRNDTPFSLTIDGVSQRWLDEFPPGTLMRPVAVLDGGNERAPVGAGEQPSFHPVTIAPHDEHRLVLELRTTGDLADACRRWMPGTAMGWESIPVDWRWSALAREDQIPLGRSVQLAAPTAADCGR